MTLPSGHHLITFVLAASVLIAIPGPNHLYIASRSAASGRARGIAAAVGVEIGTAVVLMTLKEPPPAGLLPKFDVHWLVAGKLADLREKEAA
jgi:hypothetical protein